MSNIRDDAQNALLENIARQAAAANGADQLRKLAEAFAWAVSPNQPHGGAASSE
jgi:hypothetical protein